MTDVIEIYDPRAEAPTDRPHIKMALRRAGTVIGVIDNGKPNFDVLMGHITALFQQQHHFDEVIYKTKTTPSAGAPEEWYDELAERCSLALAGSAD